MLTIQDMRQQVNANGSLLVKSMMEKTIEMYGEKESESTIRTAYQLTLQRVKTKPALAN